MCSEFQGGSIVNSLVEMLGKDDVQGQKYAATALTNIAADPAVQEQMVGLGAIPCLIAILRDNMGAGPAAAGEGLFLCELSIAFLNAITTLFLFLFLFWQGL